LLCSAFICCLCVLGVHRLLLCVVAGVVATSDEAEAFRGVSFAVLIGGWPRKEGMQRKDLIANNVPIYQSQAFALQQHAAPNCKVQSRKKMRL
jgi:malate dehydrogenase